MKLIAIDLDGTLLSHNQIISEENISAIRKAQEHHHKIVISSGRSFHDTKQILEDAKINCPFITGNGSISYDQQNIIRKLVIPTDSLENIIATLDDMSIYYELYTKNGLYFLPHGKSILLDEIDYLKNLDKNFPVNDAHYALDVQYSQHGWKYIQDEDFKNLAALDIYKVYSFSFDLDKLQRAKKIFAGRDDISSTSSFIYNFEMAHKESSKGNALVHLADYFNIPLENTVAIGDNYNDISMFNVAGVSIAMGNAEDAVKRESNHTTLSNDEHGVARAIDLYVLNKKLSESK